MKLPLSAAALAFALTLVGTARARLLETVPNDTYGTVQEAVDAAAAETDGGIITVKRGTYTDALTLKSGVTVQGEETAQTILRGGIAADGGGILQGCTISGEGAVFSGAQGIEVRGNIFKDISGVALNLQRTKNATVANNTFYNTGTALTLGSSSGLIQANLFRNNGTAVSWDNDPGISFEVNFFDRQSQDPTEDTTADRDPLLVAPDSGDFHLALGSPCIDGAAGAGIQDPDNSDADQGAYGGPNADPRPFPVAGLTVEMDSGGTAATLTWSANLAYSTTGYGVYYGPTSAYNGSSAANGASP
ncbi:MAG: right-handed parallel beta-helix repeat-containing protein, partial [Proteobacteria bacterium]|nr:right-handed parallel beta-helix repeat-containing protein [Pseudomonadota bacterium]